MDAVDQIEVEITNPDHILDAGQFYALQAAVEKLKGAHEKSLPGYTLALAKLELMASHQKADLLARNYRLLAKAGHDLSKFKLVQLRGHRLTMEPFDLAELSE